MRSEAGTFYIWVNGVNGPLPPAWEVPVGSSAPPERALRVGGCTEDARFVIGNEMEFVQIIPSSCTAVTND